MQVFICYSHKDKRFAERLASDLRARGAPVWRDVDDIPKSVAARTTTWRDAVNRALRESTHQIVILSPDAVSSAEVSAEWNYFLSSGKPVLPVVARDCEIPYRLYSLQYYDLREDYDAGFKTLVEALYGEAASPPARPRQRIPRRVWIAGALLALALIAGVFGLPRLLAPGPDQPTGEPPLTEFPTVTDEPTVEPTPIPTSDPAIEAMTATAAYQAADRAVQQAVVNFDREMRYALQTGDARNLSSVARNDALNERLDALNILIAAGNCYWVYNHRSLTIQAVTFTSETRAEVSAALDRDGRVLCEDGERTQYAYEGPKQARYVVELFEDGWLVTDAILDTEE